MGTVRFETYNVSGYMIEQLKIVGMLTKMIHDGGDIVLFDIADGQTLSVHLIDSCIPVYEIRHTLKDHAAKGYYTMFMLWTRMMLPTHGQSYIMDDWMEAFYSLNGQSIYGYDFIDGQAYIFPVYFRGMGLKRQVEYGTTVRFRQLETRTVETFLPGFESVWQVADFEGTAQQQAYVSVSDALATHYELLGVVPGDDAETIKQAYRHLARRYHPDTNPSEDATVKMQAINEAYKKILESL